MMSCKLKCALVIGMCLVGSIAFADTLELKNGSVIEGKFIAGTETAITFQVASTDCSRRQDSRSNGLTSGP